MKMIKKIVAALLVAVMAVSSAAVSAFAATVNDDSLVKNDLYDDDEKDIRYIDDSNSVERQKLGILVIAYIDLFCTYMGRPTMYAPMGDEWQAQAILNAFDVYVDDNLSDEEYKAAKDKMYEAVNNFDVGAEVAKCAYDNALKEENYNNWYSDEQWSDFQNKRDKLGKALEKWDGKKLYNQDVTYAYNDMLDTYNKMTNAYTVKGDINKDGKVNIHDVTEVQKYVVGIGHLTGAQKMLTNSLRYENLNISAVTNLLKYVVGLKTEFENNYIFLNEQDSIEYFDDCVRWHAFCNFNICERNRPGGVVSPHINNDYTDLATTALYKIRCEEKGLEP